MTVLLTEQLDVLAGAPGGVKRLRELVLELAVRGRLVPQDADDEPASVLLGRIRGEKARLVREGKIKKDKALPEIGEGERPFEVPEGWSLTVLGSVIELISGQHLGPSEYFDSQIDKAIPYLTGPAEFGDESPFPTRFTFEKRAVAIKGDILITVKGSGVGKLNNVSQPELAISRQLMAIRPNGVDCDYAKIILLSMFEHFQSKSIGIAIPGISREDVLCSVIGIPPLPEQHRIVAKVDELMALCDRLETAQTDSEQAHQTLVNELLAALTQSPTPQDFAENWQRLADHFDLLFTTEQSIEALKKSVLQWAVMGKLVPQDPADEPASALLKRIAVEKARLVREGKIKKDKPLSEIGEGEKPFEVPEGWEWTTPESVCISIVDCPHSTPKFISNGYLSLDTNCFKQGRVTPEKFRFVSEDTYIERNRRLTPQAGDIVFAREGSVGESVVIPDNLPCCLGQRVMLFRPYNKVNSNYFRLCLSEPSALSRLLAMHKGVGAKHVNVADMRVNVHPPSRFKSPALPRQG